MRQFNSNFQFNQASKDSTEDDDVLQGRSRQLLSEKKGVSFRNSIDVTEIESQGNARAVVRGSHKRGAAVVSPPEDDKVLVVVSSLRHPNKCTMCLCSSLQYHENA